MITRPRLAARAAISTLALLLAAPAFTQGAAPAGAPALPPAVSPAAGQTDPAAGPQDWGQTGLQLQWRDSAVKPGDDFARHANGKWDDKFTIPTDRTSWGAFQMLAVESEAQVHAILTDLVTQKPAADTPEGRIVAAYTAFMNQEAIERAGLAPARPVLDRIAAAQSRADLYALFAAPGLPSPIETSVDADAKQSDRYALQLSLGGLGLPDRDYYLSDNPRYPAIRAQYKAYLALLLKEAGHAEPEKAAEAVYALEAGMAATMWDRSLLRDSDITYNKLTMAEVAALPNGADLAAFIRAVGPGAAAAGPVIVAEMPPTPAELAGTQLSPAEIKAKLGGGMPAMLAFVAAQPLETWKAWAAAHFLIGHAPYLPRRIDEANFAFYGKLLSGQPEQRARWKRGITVVESQLGELLGRIYAEKHFPPTSKAAMDELVANLRKAMAANLAALPWMSPATRAEAEAKLAAFTPKIGAPERYKDYAGLTVSADSALANALASENWSAAFHDQRIGQPVDRSEWFMLPQTVNAYYSPERNEIAFPAAILQPPFFNPAADPAVNYGAIGAVIGHEMGHGFDDQGSKFDGTGNLRDWWTAADKARFKGLTAKLVAQYNAFCPFDSGQTCVNGKLTLGENIGDLGGLSLAYRAYRLSLGGKSAPVIEGLTGDQRFFLSWAQVWRSKQREEAARQQLLVDPHAPAQYRINGIVRNFGEWYAAFGVKPGDRLYLAPRDRVQIW